MIGFLTSHIVLKRLYRLGRVEKIKNAPILMRHESKVAFRLGDSSSEEKNTIKIVPCPRFTKNRAKNGRLWTRETDKCHFPGQKWPELAEKLWADAWDHSDQGPISEIYLNLAVDFSGTKNLKKSRPRRSYGKIHGDTKVSRAEFIFGY